MNTEYGEALGRLREYLQDLVKHEKLIRGCVYRYPKLNYDAGLCSNIEDVLRDSNTCRTIRITIREHLFRLTFLWKYHSGNCAFPVPSSLSCRDWETAHMWFMDSKPRDMWCEGAYADARWEYIKYLAENI